MAVRSSRSAHSAMNSARNSASSAATGRRNAAFKSSSSCIQRYKRCMCGDKALLFTARTAVNYGRVFWRCPHWKKPGTCNYFQWVDEDDDDEGGIDIVGFEAEALVEENIMEELKRKNMKLKKKLNDERFKGNVLIVVMILSWLLTITLGLTCAVKCFGIR